EHCAIVRLPTLGLIDHEFLEGREAAVDHSLYLILVIVPAGDADVEGVVDERLPFRLLHPVVGGLAERFTSVRDREIDQRRDAAARTRSGSGSIVVGWNGPADRT